MKNRRKKFLIDKPLQFRYMASIAAALLLVSSAIILSLYFGIWGGVLDAFSDEKLREDLLTASRLTAYERARIAETPEAPSALDLFKQAEKLSIRQREVFKGILDRTHRALLEKLLLLLLLIAWGSIYLSHKIAGPLYRFQTGLNALGQGDLSARIHLRKFDEAQSLAVKMNEALEDLDQRISRLKRILQGQASDPQRLKSLLHEELSKLKTSVDG